MTEKWPEQVYVLPEYVGNRSSSPGPRRNRCYRLLMEHYADLPAIPALAEAFDAYLAAADATVLATKHRVAMFRTARATGEQPSLFDAPALAATHGHANSRVKADAQTTDLHRVWLHLASRRRDGATSSEVERALRLSHQTASAVLHSLQAAGEAVALLQSR